jgi:aspartate aminotransferase-like enzyme
MMPTQPEFGTFFLPGPTEVRQEVLQAMLGPMIPHRSTAFEDLFSRLQTGLRELFQTRRNVFVSASSGTGMMEAAIRAMPAGRILSLVNGAFSERFAHIAEMCGREVHRYEVAWGEVHNVEALDVYLAANQYRAITVTHSETSTGALNAVRKISDKAHEHGVLCLIDSGSGLGGAELRFDEWQLDYVLTGSQKAIALPPGLAFSVASEEVVSLAEKATNRGVYFDIVEMDRFAKSNQVTVTPAFSLLYALYVQLSSIMNEGVTARWNRHAAMARLVSEWADGTDGVENIVKPEFRAPTVSTIRVPERMDARDFVKRVAGAGIVIGTGYGKLADTTFRIGHMGDHTIATIARCLAACDGALHA